MVNSLRLMAKRVHLQVSWRHIAWQIKFLVILLVLLSLSDIFRLRLLRVSLPLENVWEPVIEKTLVSTPAASSIARSRGVSSQSVSSKSKPSISSNPLCKDVKDFWVLIPDPAHEGQYVICNTVAEKMTTVGELNTAQNDFRRDHNINVLNINQDLCVVAAERAKEISTNFSHDGFEAAIDRHNIGKSAVGENIASGPLLGIHFVQWAWDRSPGHRENMLRDWTEGCGGIYDRFAVFLFAK